ncbi:unnamed protein product [Callosobruchus maculatus]|uniref:Uncharacterized protein n=1 Tax=Callosobruchus maculatus TaxID=64391 RepID=A0A653BNP5_CALMS|nr:unnamed protein product [Callosobruchus maculatus]
MSDTEEPESYEIVTDEHMIALIEAVSQYPEIYNPKNKCHKDQDILYMAWKEVGRDLYEVNVRVSGYDCMLKWRAIRKAYLAHFRKNSQAKYKYADHLRWLHPYIEPLKPRGARKSKDSKKVSETKAAKSSDAKTPSRASKPSSAEKISKSRAKRPRNALEPGSAVKLSDPGANKPSDAEKNSNARAKRSRYSLKPSNTEKSSNSGAKKSSNAEKISEASAPASNVVIEDEIFEEKVDTAFGSNDTSPRNSIAEQNGVDDTLRNEDIKIDVELSEVSQCSQEHTVSVTREEDTEMLFLKSILPDLQKMTDRQRNEFKLKTIQLIGDILYPTP